jgi:hypothetical protein
VAPVPNPGAPGEKDVASIYSTEYKGRPEGPHPLVISFIPFTPDHDFKGKDLNPWGTTILRWVNVFKYPQGVPVEEADKWYVDVHAKEVMQQPGLIRYYSYRCITLPGHPAYPWHRVSDLWYTDFVGWKKSVVDSPPKYTKPPWGQFDNYPFLEPYVDFVSTFILERPDKDFLRDYMVYYIRPL